MFRPKVSSSFHSFLYLIISNVGHILLIKVTLSTILVHLSIACCLSQWVGQIDKLLKGHGGGGRSPPEFYKYSGPKWPDKIIHFSITAHAQGGVKSANNQRREEKRREKRRRARTTTALPQTPRHMNSLTMPPER
jgi:hypothetical protein